MTNTYQASVEGYNEYLDYTTDQSIKLIKDTVRLAHVARSMFLNSEGVQNSAISIPWIIGSIVSGINDGLYLCHLHYISKKSMKFQWFLRNVMWMTCINFLITKMTI